MDIPDFVSERAREHWDTICDTIIKSREVIHDADVLIISVACEHWAIWQKCNEELESAAMIYPTDSGYLQQHPAIAMRNKAMNDYKACLTKLGLTTIDRAKTKDKSPGAHQAKTGRKPKGLKAKLDTNIIEKQFRQNG